MEPGVPRGTKRVERGHDLGDAPRLHHAHRPAIKTRKGAFLSGVVQQNEGGGFTGEHQVAAKCNRAARTASPRVPADAVALARGRGIWRLPADAGGLTSAPWLSLPFAWRSCP